MEKALARTAVIGLAVLSGAGLWWLSRAPVGQADVEVRAPGVVTAASPRGLDEGLVTVGIAAAPGSATADRDAIQTAAGQWSQVEFRVVDRNGPVAGARIRPDPRFQAHRPGTDAESVSGEDFVTDPSGILVLDVWAHRQETIKVARNTSAWAQEVTWRSAAPGGRTTLEIRLLLGPQEVELLVRSFPGGAAIEGATVTVGSASTMTVALDAARCTTDERGLMPLPATLPDAKEEYRITVFAEGHAKQSLTQGAPDGDGQQTVWLKRNATLQGTVALAGSPSSAEDAPLPRVYFLPESGLMAVVRGRQEPLTTARWSRGDLADAGPSDPLTDGRSFLASSVRQEAETSASGAWTIAGIQFEDDLERLEEHALIVQAHGRARVIARGIAVGPGDVVVLDDPWLGSPALDMRFVLDGDRPAADLGKVVLTPEPAEDSAAPALDEGMSGAVGSDGRLWISALPPGRWRWQLRSHAPLSGVSGVVDHRDAATQTVRLVGYSSLRGRIEMPPKDPASKEGTAKTFFGTHMDYPRRVSPPRAVHWRLADDSTDGQGSAHPQAVGTSGAVGVVISEPDGTFRLPLVPMGRAIQIGHAPARSSSVELGVDFNGPESATVAVGTEELTSIVLSWAQTLPSITGR